ncbi:UDP-N-acetylmuramate dehydrogenase [Formivibrio citricus]|nr:UDP-N-acetylmuramate dehydrogenase [Formivibrio citricus]
MPLVESDIDLTPFNTLGLPGRARHFVRLESAEELAGLRADSRLADLPWRVLGGGSNLWLQGDLDALVIKVEIPGRHLLRETNDALYVSAGGGENWDEFVLWTLQQGWGGLENLALIPGTVGAAPVQNIGAYGVEVKDCLHDLTAFHLKTGERRVFGHAECRFAYRDSIFKHEEAGKWLIANVTFRLPKHHQPATGYGEIGKELAAAGLPATPQAVAQAVSSVRRRKLPDPAELGNAGSFFHNPIVESAIRERILAQYPDLVSYAQPDGRWKLAAGWLIEQCGWRGHALGPVAMYEKQALVLVNLGGASCADVARLAETVQRDVKQRFGVDLIAEPVRW